MSRPARRVEFSPRAARRRYLFCALACVLLPGCRESDTLEGVRVGDVSAVEGYVETDGRRLWYRVVNPDGRGIPLLAQAGGPAPSHYLEPLEELADERPVVFYDQFGTGRSSRALGTIAVPTLFIGGEHDEAPPETVRWHAEMVPEAQVVIIPGASHMPMLENPTLFNETVRGFLHGT